MPPDPDPLAAELTAIGDRAARSDRLEVWTRVAAAEKDRVRLLKAAQRVKALADQWYGERGNDYSASAQYASKLREVLSEELLSEGESRNG